MALSVTIFFDDNNTIGSNVAIDLLNNAVVVDTAVTDDSGSVTFDVDPSTLSSPAVRVNPNPPSAA